MQSIKVGIVLTFFSPAPVSTLCSDRCFIKSEKNTLFIKKKKKNHYLANFLPDCQAVSAHYELQQEKKLTITKENQNREWEKGEKKLTFHSGDLLLYGLSFVIYSHFWIR